MTTPTPTGKPIAFRQTIELDNPERDLICVTAFDSARIQLALHAETSVTFYLRSPRAARELGAALIGAAAAAERIG